MILLLLMVFYGINRSGTFVWIGAGLCPNFNCANLFLPPQPPFFLGTPVFPGYPCQRGGGCCQPNLCATQSTCLSTTCCQSSPNCGFGCDCGGNAQSFGSLNGPVQAPIAKELPLPLPPPLSAEHDPQIIYLAIPAQMATKTGEEDESNYEHEKTTTEVLKGKTTSKNDDISTSKCTTEGPTTTIGPPSRTEAPRDTTYHRVNAPAAMPPYYEGIQRSIFVHLNLSFYTLFKCLSKYYNMKDDAYFITFLYKITARS